MSKNRRCYVPLCTSGYCSNKEKVSLFQAPQDDDRRAVWNATIGRKDRILSKRDVICRKHFDDEAIITHWRSANITIPYQRPKLSKTAIPTILPKSTRKRGKSGNTRKILHQSGDVFKGTRGRRSKRKQKLSASTEPEHQDEDSSSLKNETDIGDTNPKGSDVESSETCQESVTSTAFETIILDEQSEVVAERSRSPSPDLAHLTLSLSRTASPQTIKVDYDNISSSNIGEFTTEAALSKDINILDALITASKLVGTKSDADEADVPNVDDVAAKYVEHEENVGPEQERFHESVSLYSPPPSSSSETESVQLADRAAFDDSFEEELIYIVPDFDNVVEQEDQADACALDLSDGCEDAEIILQCSASASNSLDVQKYSERTYSNRRRKKTAQRRKRDAAPGSPTDARSRDVFKDIFDKKKKVSLPSSSWCIFPMTENGEDYILISEMLVRLKMPCVKRQLMIASDLSISLYLGNYLINERVPELIDKPIASMSDVEILIRMFNMTKMCLGGPTFKEFPKNTWRTECAYADLLFNSWRHNECTFTHSSPIDFCCTYCQKLFKTFKKKKERTHEGTRFRTLKDERLHPLAKELEEIRIKRHNELKQKLRLVKRIEKLENTIAELLQNF